MSLELGLAVLIVAKVHKELVHGIGEGAVLWVFVKLVGQKLGLVDNAVGVVPVALPKEEVALVVDLVPLVVGLVLHNIALLLQALADEGVEVFEPATEFRILVSITVDLVDRIKPVVARSAVRETLNEDLQIGQQ